MPVLEVKIDGQAFTADTLAAHTKAAAKNVATSIDNGFTAVNENPWALPIFALEVIGVFGLMFLIHWIFK